MSDQHNSRQRADGRTKRQTRPSTQSVFVPEHAITDLDESYKPQDIVDALRDIRFGQGGPKMLRIDAQVRDYFITAVSALSGHRRR